MGDRSSAIPIEEDNATLHDDERGCTVERDRTRSTSTTGNHSCIRTLQLYDDHTGTSSVDGGAGCLPRVTQGARARTDVQPSRKRGLPTGERSMARRT